MTTATRTFRIFVSSTFSDLVTERNALQAYVFPRLRELCQQHGCRFQAIDPVSYTVPAPSASSSVPPSATWSPSATRSRHTSSRACASCASSTAAASRPLTLSLIQYPHLPHLLQFHLLRPGPRAQRAPGIRLPAPSRAVPAARLPLPGH